MMLSTRLFTFFLTFIFIISASEFADARTIQKKGRNNFESEKRVDSTDLTIIEVSLTLRLLDQMKTCIYARLLENASLIPLTPSRARIDFR